MYRWKNQNTKLPLTPPSNTNEQPTAVLYELCKESSKQNKQAAKHHQQSQTSMHAESVNH